MLSHVKVYYLLSYDRKLLLKSKPVPFPTPNLKFLILNNTIFLTLRVILSPIENTIERNLVGF